MIKLILGGLIGAALFASVVKAEDQKTVTPQEFVNSVVAVPGKVSTHLQNEWVDIKAYQAKSWADSKDQFQRTVDSIKGLFTKTK
tara:strand:- start:105 stop:359 length:255 start_codon:yes stop_codon:yes gene_type:complete